MAEPRTYHQFKKIVRATAEKGSADIILANVKDDKQMKDLISLYEMQKSTKTFDRVEYADLLREVADPLGYVWPHSGKSEGSKPRSQGPLPYKPEAASRSSGVDKIDDLINEVQSEPKKKKKISAEKLLGEKSKSKAKVRSISPDKLVPPGGSATDVAKDIGDKTEQVEESKKPKTKQVITPDPVKRINPSKLMGSDSPALGRVGQGGESKVGKLSRIVRTTRVKVNTNEKDIKINIDKLMNVEDEQEQIHESIFNLVEKQADSQKGSQASESIEKLSENLNTIAKELASISGLLNKQLNTEEKQSKALAAAAVSAQRRDREKRIESRPAKKEASGILDVVKKPMGNFFDVVKRFLGNIIAGGAVLTLLKWLNDPKNQEGIAKFVDFFTENLPQILLKALGILTSGFNKVIGNFINLLIDISKKTYKLLKGILKFGKNILKRGLKFVKNLGKGLIDQITKEAGKKATGELAEGAGKEATKKSARSKWLKKMFEPIAKVFPKTKNFINSAIPNILRRVPFIGIGIDIALNKGLNGQDWTEAIVRGLFSGSFGTVGAVAGAKAGGFLGGTIGLALGGIGAIPGAAIGAGLGGLIGGIAANYLGDMTGEKVLQALGYETTSDSTTTTSDTSEGMGATPAEVESPEDDSPSLEGLGVDFSEGLQEAEDTMAELSGDQSTTEAPPAPTLPAPEKPPTDFMAAMESTGVRTLTGPDADEKNALKYDMNKAKVSTPDMFSRSTPMIYNLPSVKMDDEVIYLPPPKEKGGDPSASSSASQKVAPIFPPSDPMNISFTSVISIYNAIT